MGLYNNRKTAYNATEQHSQEHRDLEAKVDAIGLEISEVRREISHHSYFLTTGTSVLNFLLKNFRL